MAWSPEDIAKLEEIIEKLTGESHIATPGGDEGLIPIFSLITDLGEAFPEEPAFKQAADATLDALQPLLDTAAPWDESTIASIQSLAKWGSSCLENLRNDSPLPAFGSEETSTPKPESEASEANFAIPADAEIESTQHTEDSTPDAPAEEPIPFQEATEDLSTDCPWGIEKFDKFSELSAQFSSELLLSSNGSDEGMLPIYSLLKDFQQEFEDVEIVLTSVEPAVNKMDSLLDSAQPFDSTGIKLLSELNFWFESARAELREGRIPMPFEASEEAIATPAEEAAEDAASSSGAELENEFVEFDVVMDLNMEENQELLVEFHTEAVDHLGQIETAVLEFEQDMENSDAIASMFRSFHTIKGVAGFLNLIPVNRLAHEIESLMDLVRNDEMKAFTGIIDLVLEAKDCVSALIEQISEALNNGTLPSEVIPVSHLMQRARWAMKGETEYIEIMGKAGHNVRSTDGGSAPAAEAPAPDADEGGIDIDLDTDASPAIEAEKPAAAASAPATPAAQKSPPQDAPTGVKKNASQNATIRVNTWKLDNLMDMVGELVIVQSQLRESSKDQMHGNSLFQQNMSQLTRITKELQHNSMALRMIPIKPTFQKMGRIVRDLSAKSGKKVRFEVVGEETELDRNVVEEIGDPLVHMVRNALDHGLEPPEDRAAAGKDETGHVSLKAYHQGSNIVIELSDDGRGIDPDKVLQKAIANGVVREDENLTKEEIYKLIFAPGFSTAEEITDISGRGVGMDVVRKNIEKLRGKIEIESELGNGSVFKILLPLTMAIVDGLVVKVGDDRFILPTTSVKVALRPDQETLAKIQGNQEILNIRGKVIPLFRLHNHFQIPNAVSDPRDATVVVVETASKPCGLLVDDMVSKQEVVIKSLGSMMQGIPGVSGGAILGDGTIALILDPATLITDVA
ncbi:MAG: chemotaxis protein CheA [Verrucomicrobiota bacterium]